MGGAGKLSQLSYKLSLSCRVQPNKGDMRNRLEPGFGATIMIINGGIECGHGSEKPQALHRQAYYRKFAEYFKVMRH